MRATFFLIACLSVTASVTADFSVGNPEDGDILVVQRNITKPGIPILPRIVKLGATAPPGSVIAYVNVEDLGNDTSSSLIVIGGIGAPKVLVLTKAKAGDGLNIEFTVYAKSLPTTTVGPPETTASALEPSTLPPTAAAPTTAGPTTGAPVTTGPIADTPGTAVPSTAGPSTSDDY